MNRMPDKKATSILIVDDEPSILYLLEEQISCCGYNTMAAPHAEAAFQLAGKQAKIDLLITDIVMPGMNGIDLAKEITTLHPNIRVVFMSGQFDDALFKKNFPGRDYEFMAKPFALDILMDKIQNILTDPKTPQQ